MMYNYVTILHHLTQFYRNNHPYMLIFSFLVYEKTDFKIKTYFKIKTDFKITPVGEGVFLFFFKFSLLIKIQLSQTQGVNVVDTVGIDSYIKQRRRTAY